MARVFNIYFTHDEVLHSAIVSVRQTPDETEYVLGNLDTDLRLQLPSNRIVAKGRGILSFRSFVPGFAGELVNAILGSLARHLKATNTLL